MNNLFNYEVQKVPAQFTVNGELLTDPNYFAIIGENNKRLSYRSAQYNLFNNERFTELSYSIRDRLGMELVESISHKSGAYVISYFKNPDEDLNVLGYKFSDKVALYDSRNGQTALSIGGVGKFSRCANVFPSLRANKTHLRINHNSSLEYKIEYFKTAMEHYHKLQQAYIAELAKLQEIDVTQKNVYQLIGNWTKLTPEEVRDVAYGTHKGIISTKKKNIVDGLVNSWGIESSELGNTGFALWNAATHYYTHNRRKTGVNFLLEDAGKREAEARSFAEAL